MTTAFDYDRYARLGPEAIFALRDELLETQRPVLDLLEGIPAPSAILCRERQAVVFNERFQKLCENNGLSPEGLRHGDAIQCSTARSAPGGCGTGERCSHCGGMKAVVTAIMESRATTLEAEFFTLAGPRTIVVSSAPCQLGSHAYTNLVIQDVTALRELEKTHEQARRMEALAMLISGVAHEINNPLAIASGNLFLLRQHLDTHTSNDPRMSDLLEKLEDAHLRMATLVRSFGRLRSDEDWALMPLDLTALLSSALRSALNLAKSGGIEISTLLERPRHAVLGTRPWVLRVLENIFTNAIDALQNAPSPRIALSVRSEGGQCLVEIADNGPGIPQSEISKLFLPMYTTRFRPDRPGLGLFEARRLMNAMGGEIEIRSAPGSGTTVLLRFRDAILDTDA